MDLVASPILGPVCERVIDAAHKEYTLVRDVNEEIENLASSVSAIKAVLEDAERKQLENVSVFRNWLQSLKPILFDAEDILDEIATDEALRRMSDAAGGTRSVTTSKRAAKVCNIIIPSLLCGGILHSHAIADKIQDIRKKIDFKSSEIGLLMLGGSSSSEIRTSRRPETSPLLGNEPHIIGRDDEMEEIARLLLESAEGSDNVHVIAVVGMGGVGKTTLVKHAYNNPAVKKCFELKMWVCVSNDFDLKGIMKEILYGVGNYNEVTKFNETLNWYVIQECLQDRLKGRRFLLVLDDVWEKSHPKWEDLCKPLMCGGKGSRIIVTTRSQKVANIVKGTPISLKGLSSKDLWPIFERYAFGNYEPSKRRQLISVGKKIVENLKGLPLAAKTIGRLLNTNLDLDHWRNVLEAKAWLSQREDNILEVLKLSYDYLPGHLKQCFAYCSLFPEDHHFCKDELVQLWMAQQFIEHHVERNVGGDEYFNGLVHESLLEPCMDTDKYVMHDLIQNLAGQLSKGDCFRLEGKNFEGDSKTIRHVSIVTDSFDPTKLNELCEFENIRTLLFLRSFQLDPHHLGDLFKKLQRLRVLGLNRCKIKELPMSIGTLKHLRFLDLSYNTNINKLPESLCNLLNLQVLKLQGMGIKELPTSIGTLKHLWFLDLSYNYDINKLPESLCNLLNLQVLDLRCCDLGAWPENMSALTNLKHLYAYNELPVSSIKGLGKLTALQELNFDCKRQKMKELADMDMLRELNISSLEEVKSKEEASESRLDKKEDLGKLKMRWSTADRNPELDEAVLQSLKPPSNTERLTIWNYGGIRSPDWMDYQLWIFSSSLERLELLGCTNWEVLPPLGQLPYLKFLRIQGMGKVRRMEPQFMGCRYTDGGVLQVSGFPLLEELEFRDMREWEEWEAPQLQYEYGINDGEDDRRQKQPPQQQQPPPHPQQQIIFLPCLRLLRIYRCPNLRQLPPLPPTLTSLLIFKVGLTHLPGWLPSSSISSSSSSSPALSYLRIEGCPNLTSLNDGLLRHPDLQKLWRLEIRKCQDLVSLPEIALRHLTSLKSSSVVDYPKLSRPTSISSPEEVKGKDMDMDVPGEAEVSGQEKPHKGSSFSKDDEGLEIVPEDESYSAGRQGLKNVVDQTKTTEEERLQEGGISAPEDDHDRSMISDDEELVPDPVGNEQEDSATRAYLSNDFANHHCFKPLISEELGGSIDGLVNVQGIEDALSTIKRHLVNDEVGVIKILGVGGAGKTTLLRKLCTDLNAKQVFDFKVVIVVTASKYFRHSMKIQKDIGEQLGLSLFARRPPFVQEKQASILHQALSERMPFLLLLDGAAEIELKEIGIPQPDKQNGCKIIIATDVSKEMENAEIVKVSLLDQDESKKLFLGAVQGKVVVDSTEQRKDHLAKLLDKCNGIPLALILVGRAMAFNKEEQDWLGDINKLDDLAAKDLPGAEPSVRSAIKFSYDTLKDDTLRSCLLYCCLFPEHHNIGVEELIGYWYGEGLLHDDDIDSARRNGYVFIRQLKAACLLEVGRDRENEVRMHDVVRDVLLQLTSNSHGQCSTFIVPSGSETKQAPEDEKWRQATRVSLMYSEVENLEMVPSKIPECPNLSTLLINNNLSLKQIPENFFKDMPALHVLDLSSTGIKKLPKAIGKLPVLRFLNLSKTCITSLPKELGNLSQLKQLNLSYMSSLSNIPRKAMLRLSKLQTLNLYGTTHWCIQQPGHGKQKRACIQDLESLVQLKDLRLTITTVSSLEKLQSCPSLLKSSRLLSLEQVQDLPLNLLSDISERLENLQVLKISEASNLKGLQFHKHQFQSLGFLSLEHLSQATLRVEESGEQLPFQMLRHLHIVGCHGFEDISWACQLPFLECMELRVCYGVQVLTTDDVAASEAFYRFPMLKKMLLLDLPVLERIYSYPLSLPSLEYLEVCYCPKLKKLPLTFQSARKIKEIRGHKEWWDELEWGSGSVKGSFLRHFKELRNHEEMTGQI